MLYLNGINKVNTPVTQSSPPIFQPFSWLRWQTYRQRAVLMPLLLWALMLCSMYWMWLLLWQPLQAEVAHQQQFLKSSTVPLARVATEPIGEAEQLDGFYARFPGEWELTGQLAKLFELASKHGIAFDQVSYQRTVNSGNALVRYDVNLPVKADYLHLRLFIAEALQTLPNIGLTSLDISRANVAQADVSTNLQWVLYLRAARQ